MARQDHYSVLKYGHLGLTFAILISGSFFLGMKADQRFGTGSILTLVCGAIGLAAGFYHLLRSVDRMGQEEKAKKAKQDEDERG